MWQRDYSIETSASPATIWPLWADVPGWAQWNAGIEAIELHGPFATGTRFTMKTPGQPAFTSTLRAVRENEWFEDETVIDDIRVVVSHRLEPLGSGRTRITYAAQVEGPGAEEVGPAVSGDFPEVLAALAARAEAASGASAAA